MLPWGRRDAHDNRVTGLKHPSGKPSTRIAAARDCPGIVAAMRKRTCRGCFCFMLCGVLAAGCESGPTGPVSDAGMLTNDGGGGADAPVAGDAGLASLACTALVSPTTVLESANAWALHVSGDDLVFIDRDGGEMDLLSRTGAIRKVGKDGSGDAVLYVAPKGKRVLTLNTDATQVYFLLSEVLTGGSTKAFLYSVPKAGGPSTRISAAMAKGYNTENSQLFAVNGGALYVASSDGKQRIYRVAVADGAEAVVTERDGTINTNLQLFKDDVWFTGSQGIDGIFKVPAGAVMTLPARVGTSTCGAFRVVVTDTAILCGDPLGIRALTLSGENPRLILDLIDDKQVSANNPSPADISNYYAVPVASPKIGRPLRRQAISGGAFTVVACDRRAIRDFTVSARELFWIETRNDGMADKISVFKLPK